MITEGNTAHRGKVSVIMEVVHPLRFPRTPLPGTVPGPPEAPAAPGHILRRPPQRAAHLERGIQTKTEDGPAAHWRGMAAWRCGTEAAQQRGRSQTWERPPTSRATWASAGLRPGQTPHP